MDKPSWNSSTLIQPNELSSYLHPNWDTPIDHNDPFESGLSSIVSSPAASGAGSGAGHGGMIREVIGRLGSICDSGEISPHSPPRLNLSSLSEAQIRGNFPISGTHFPNLVSLNADPGFVERAAKYSCFGSGDLGQFGGNEVPNLQSGMLSRVSSNQSIKNAQGNHKSGPFQSVNCGVEKNYNGVSRPTTPENGELGDSREGSSVSEQSPGGEIGLKSQNDANSRKRKSTPKTKGKDEKQVEGENEESNAKRSKADEEGKNVNEEPNGEREKETKPEPPKDYIHVRARRGQATDSHSLAERVRREKISERMKFLQELVPGCSKVTGKATVLDEIINYVQALQRQVEFLSMKLATVNPRADFNMEALLSKDIFQSRGPLSQTMFPLDASAPALAYGYEPHQQMPLLVGNVSNKPECPFSMNPLNGAMRENSGIQLPSLDGFGGGVTQMPPFWDSDLESIVQMGLAQNHTQSVPGTLPTNQMKVEL